LATRPLRLLWLLTGILPFQWTAHVLTDSGRLLGNDAKLVTATSVPREIWVLRTVLSRYIEFVFTLPITAFFMLVSNLLSSWTDSWALFFGLIFIGFVLFAPQGIWGLATTRLRPHPRP